MRRRFSHWLGLSLLAAALFGAETASAQECLLGPVALPALPGAPEWEDVDGNGFWRPELHDPRWSGAPLDFLSYLPSTGAPAWSDDVGVRVLAQGKIVYVSYQIQADDNGPNADDYVYLGLSEGAANGAYAIRIAADISGAAIAAPAPPPPPAVLAADSPLPTRLSPIAFSWWHTTDATAATPAWGAASSTPLTWLKAAVWNRPVLGSPRWAVTVRLDLSAAPGGLNIVGNTRFFFGGSVNQTTGDVIVGNVTPKITTDADKVGDSIIPHQKTQWLEYLEPGLACVNGATLVPNDVGIWTGAAGATSPGTLTSTICAGAGGSGSCATSDGENVFRVTAHRVDNTGGIGTFGLRARLRIADWGSQVAYWNSGRWRDLTITPAGTNVFTAPVAQLSTANGWYWHTPVADGADTSAVTIDFKCTKQGADTYCPKLLDETQTPPGSGRSHQCMLVELGQPPPPAGSPPAFKIRNNAVYRNMNYENLSTSESPATISLEGLKDVLGAAEAKDRDVYLYVEARNLPAHGEKPIWLPIEDMALARRFAENPVHVPTIPGAQPPRGELKRAGRAVTGAAAKDRQAALAAQVGLAERIATSTQTFKNGLPVRSVLAMGRDQLLDAVWPTYRVRVYFDSGKTHTIGTKTNKVLIPMVPFGYRFTHDGALYGFSHALAVMPGIDAQDLGSGWFKLRLKSEGKAKVSTKVTAEELPKPTSGPGQPPPVCPPPVKHGHCHCRLVGPTSGPVGFAYAACALAVGFGLLARRRRRRP
jgi:hypothetical protein